MKNICSHCQVNEAEFSLHYLDNTDQYRDAFRVHAVLCDTCYDNLISQLSKRKHKDVWCAEPSKLTNIERKKMKEKMKETNKPIIHFHTGCEECKNLVKHYCPPSGWAKCEIEDCVNYTDRLICDDCTNPLESETK
jgi:hypothetical protein